MNSRIKRALALLCALLMLAALPACGAGSAQPTATETAAPAAPADTPAAEPAGEPEAEPEPTPEPTPTPVPDTPAARAAAKGLPEPPDVDINSWEYRLANSNNGISLYHIPAYGGLEGQGIDPRAQESAYAFLSAARKAGYQAYIAVAYRNFDFLFMVYQNRINALGSAAAVAAVWPGPGTSEHQLGLALDFTDNYAYSAYYSYYENPGFKDSELNAWLHEHCAEYGFIDLYPEGKEYYYGTPCTEGHYRYVGEEAARYIMDNGICFEEFLMLYDPDRVFIPGAG